MCLFASFFNVVFLYIITGMSRHEPTAVRLNGLNCWGDAEAASALEKSPSCLYCQLNYVQLEAKITSYTQAVPFMDFTRPRTFLAWRIWIYLEGSETAPTVNFLAWLAVRPFLTFRRSKLRNDTLAWLDWSSYQSCCTTRSSMLAVHYCIASEPRPRDHVVELLHAYVLTAWWGIICS